MERFGQQIDPKISKTIEDVIAQNSSHLGKEVTVTGRVEKLCLKKGCWLNLKSSKGPVRVTFKDYGIFVPASFLNKQVMIKGQFNKIVESVKRQKHLLEDEGRSQKEINQITKEKEIFSLVATGIQKI